MDEASLLADRMLETAQEVLAAVPEISELQPTVEIPGQTNFVLWDTPKGIGLTAIDDGADPASLAALIFGPLLAGNGLIVASWPSSYPAAQFLTYSLINAGVPRETVLLAPLEVSLQTLVTGPVSFAAVDLTRQSTRPCTESWASQKGIRDKTGSRP